MSYAAARQAYASASCCGRHRAAAGVAHIGRARYHQRRAPRSAAYRQRVAKGDAAKVRSSAGVRIVDREGYSARPVLWNAGRIERLTDRRWPYYG